jgi:hypothetical protein
MNQLSTEQRASIIAHSWGTARNRWLEVVLAALTGKQYSRDSADFLVLQTAVNSSLKAVQLNEGLSFARRYVTDEFFQGFADQVISRVTTETDQAEVLGFCDNYLKHDQQQAYFRLSNDLSWQLSGEAISLRSALMIQQHVNLLLGFTYMAVSAAFEDGRTSAEIEQEIEKQYA